MKFLEFFQVGSSAAGYGARNPLHCVRHNLTALRLSLDANGKNKEAVEGLLDASGPPNRSGHMQNFTTNYTPDGILSFVFRRRDIKCEVEVSEWFP